MCNTQQKAAQRGFINLNPFLPQKQITIVDEFDMPVPFAEVINLDTGNGVITNSQGIATVVGYPNQRILISHVSFTDEQYRFQDLPDTINMEGEYLDEVIIGEDVQVKPKAASFAFLGVIALGIGAAMYYRSKKNKGQGLKAAVPVTL